MGRRQWLLWSALCAVLVASFWPGDGDESSAAGVRKGHKTSPTAGVRAKATGASRKDGLPTAQELAQVLMTQRPRFSVDGPDAFASHDWQPPPPPPLQEAPAKPSAPPFPFRFIGKAGEGEKVVIFVENDTESHLVREGDAVGAYKFTKITADSATLLYVPLNETLFLRF